MPDLELEFKLEVDSVAIAAIDVVACDDLEGEEVGQERPEDGVVGLEQHRGEVAAELGEDGDGQQVAAGGDGGGLPRRQR